MAIKFKLNVCIVEILPALHIEFVNKKTNLSVQRNKHTTHSENSEEGKNKKTKKQTNYIAYCYPLHVLSLEV